MPAMYINCNRRFRRCPVPRRCKKVPTRRCSVSSTPSIGGVDSVGIVDSLKCNVGVWTAGNDEASDRSEQCSC